jgi:hypothetical protein
MVTCKQAAGEVLTRWHLKEDACQSLRLRIALLADNDDASRAPPGPVSSAQTILPNPQ